MYTPNPPSISVSKPDLGFEGFGDLFTCIRNKNVPLQNMHFVTYRNNLNKIWPLLISGISLGKWGCTKGMVLSISMYINSQKGQKVIWNTEGLSQRLFLDLEKIYFPPEQ